MSSTRQLILEGPGQGRLRARRMVRARCARWPALLAPVTIILATGSAQAHFRLESPPAMTQQNALGDPQKAPPCGDNGRAIATGKVTTYRAGSTVEITIDEVIPHPGHYRVALAVADPSELPANPPVTPGTTPCGSAPIQDPAVFPVLVDGALRHTTPLDGPQTIEVTLPDDVTCSRCTLQVIEFMSNHGLNVPGGCFYHHCATIAITDDPSEMTPDTGSDPGPASGDSAADSAEARDTEADGSTESDADTVSAGASPAETSGSEAGGPEANDGNADRSDASDADRPTSGYGMGCTLHGGRPPSDLALCLVGLGWAFRRLRRARSPRS